VTSPCLPRNFDFVSVTKEESVTLEDLRPLCDKDLGKSADVTAGFEIQIFRLLAGIRGILAMAEDAGDGIMVCLTFELEDLAFQQ
jgi:hypothetical protein